jgi:hypothetical protein
MVEFLSGLACMVLGLVVSLIVIGLSSVTIATASFWYWLPTIVGVVLGLLIWSGGELLDILD